MEQHQFPETRNVRSRALETCRWLLNRPGVHSTITMYSAGFQYTGTEDTVRCDRCGLEVSGWTLEMKPFLVHAERKPECSYVRSLLSDKSVTVPSTPIYLRKDDEQRSSRRQKTETSHQTCLSHKLIEIETLKQIRKRTFSHWPHRTMPSSAQMIEAGFFSCNVGDRVICLYCNIICEHWILNTDDPCEVHKTLSPKCPYVLSKLTNQQILLSSSSHPSQSTSQLQYPP